MLMPYGMYEGPCKDISIFYAHQKVLAINVNGKEKVTYMKMNFEMFENLRKILSGRKRNRASLSEDITRAKRGLKKQERTRKMSKWQNIKGKKGNEHHTVDILMPKMGNHISLITVD